MAILFSVTSIDQIRKSYNASVPYPTITRLKINMHISVLNGALWDMGQVHCGICEIGLFADLSAADFPWQKFCNTWLRHMFGFQSDKTRVFSGDHRQIIYFINALDNKSYVDEKDAFLNIMKSLYLYSVLINCFEICLAALQPGVCCCCILHTWWRYDMEAISALVITMTS